jgi:hypothetical protein
MEGIDLRPILDPEGDVQVRQKLFATGVLDLEQAAIADVERSEHALLSEGQAVPQGHESPLIESLAPIEIADFDGYVVDQG